MSIKLVLIVTVILGWSSFATAQKDYAVLTKGDTIKGDLKIYSFDNLDRLQINSNGKKSTFTALQVKSFRKEGLTYQPVKHDNTFRFMKLIKAGYLSLYAFSASGQGSLDALYLLKKDGTGMEVPNLSFKKLISKYLGDCEEMQSRIEKGGFSKTDIEKIVDQYNSCLQAKTEAKRATSASSEKMVALATFIEKVEAENFLTKNDVLDLLRDIKTKVSSKENVPNYLTESLKTYLADTPTLLKEAEELVVLLKK